jgi:hypothetical protein
MQLQHTFHSAYSASAIEMHADLVESDANQTAVAAADRETLHYLMERSADYVITHRCAQPMPLRVSAGDTESATSDALCTSFVLHQKPLLWGAAASLLHDLAWSTIGQQVISGGRPRSAVDGVWWCPNKNPTPRTFTNAVGTSTSWSSPPTTSCGIQPRISVLLITVFPAAPEPEHWSALSRLVASLRATGSTAEVAILLPASCDCARDMALFIEAMVAVRAEEYNDAHVKATTQLDDSAVVFPVIANFLVTVVGSISTALIVPLDTAFQQDPFAAIEVPDGGVAVAMTTPTVRSRHGAGWRTNATFPRSGISYTHSVTTLIFLVHLSSFTGSRRPKNLYLQGDWRSVHQPGYFGNIVRRYLSQCFHLHDFAFLCSDAITHSHHASLPPLKVGRLMPTASRALVLSTRIGSTASTSRTSTS